MRPRGACGRHWNETRPWTRGATSAPKYQPPAEEAFNRHALIWPEDRDPLDVLLRRTQALADDLQSSPDAQTVFAQDRAALAALAASAAKTPISDIDARFALFLKTMRLRRAIAFKNPLLKSIDKLLFITREVFPTQELDWGTHICDQFFGFHARAKESSRGDGLYVLENPFSDNPKLVNLLQNRVVEKGPWKGRRLIDKPGWDDARTGGFLSPDVSFDGQEILFCYTKAASRSSASAAAGSGAATAAKCPRTRFSRCSPTAPTSPASRRTRRTSSDRPWTRTA